MKKLTFALILILFSFSTVSAQIPTPKEDVVAIKKAISKGGFLSKNVQITDEKNFLIEAQGRKVVGDFKKYLLFSEFDMVPTNHIILEYYSGKKDFLIISIIEDGIVNIFIDLDADGNLDEFISGGKKITGKLYQEDYALWLGFFLGR